ncbi:MAG: M15 family metallopeptidase [Polaromonas sp.]|uniref:M15 family metallopeptidase n=1 Tax=Polaromonas sp. TaxID=1869339 RepID=UPI0017912DCC|nr:M15 family metallopeptidase [Polaromonas sp.]NMM08664.1 M15 family metallopeptidase [Polaromonas sp.]
MVFGFVVLYFLLACFVVWVALFPEGRELADKLVQKFRNAGRHVTEGGATLSIRTLSKAALFSSKSGGAFRQGANWIERHWWSVIFGLLLVILPPVGILIFSSGLYLDGFSTDRVEINSQVAELLKGEQLVPPAPLPPDIFASAEVAQVRPFMQSASRNWQLLDQEFSQRVLLAFKIMREKHGYEMAILEGYRSPERQDMLSQMGTQVTSAKAFQSYHQFGLAVDCAFLLNGKLVVSEKDPWAMKGYALYGEVAESVGLTWGGRWKMMDFGHIEWRKPGFIK